MADKSWFGGPGQWDDDALWSPFGAPQAGDAVLIFGRGNVLVTSILSISLESLYLSGISILSIGQSALDVTSTASRAIDVPGGTTILIAGGTIDSAGGFYLRGTLRGSGTVSSDLVGSGDIVASNGTLTLSGTIGSNSYFDFAIDSSSPATLKFTGSASMYPITLDNPNQTLEIGSGGTLKLMGFQRTSSGTILLSGGTLTSDFVIQLDLSAKLNGYGTVTGTIIGGYSIAGSVTASGGTLTLSSNVSFQSLAGGGALNIGPGTSDKLLLNGATNRARSVIFLGSTGTLQTGSSANLTVFDGMAVGANTVSLGSSSTLTIDKDITLAGGTISGDGTLASKTDVSGYGTISLNLSTAGSLTASGGTLTLSGTVSGRTLAMGTTANSRLKIAGTVASDAIAMNHDNKTLEVATGGSLTLSAAQSVTGGQIVMSGGILTDNFGLTLSSKTLSGFGTVTGAITNESGTVTASGGTLTLSSGISGTGTDTLMVGSAANDRLLLNGTTNQAASVTFAGSTGTLETGASAALTVTNAMNVGANTVSLGASSTLTATNDITLEGGTISGAGALAANTDVSGYGTISLKLSTGGSLTASGGTLTLGGTVSGRTLAMDTIANSRLKIGGTVSSDTITIDNFYKTLEVAAGGSLTLSLAQDVTTGQIVMSGGTLADASGLFLAGAAILSGYGTVTASVDGTGTVTATGGTLEITGAVGATTPMILHVGSAAGSVLKLSGPVGSAGARPTVMFDGGGGVLELGSLATFNGVVSGFSGGEAIKVAGAAAAVLDASGTFFTVYDASHAALGVITLSSSYIGSEFDVSSGLISVGLDVTAPTGGAPVLALASDSGLVGDGITSVTDPSFIVSLGPTVAVGDTVQLLLDGLPLAHAVTHSITFADIEAGFVTLAVTAGDLGADGVKLLTARFGGLANHSSGAMSQIALDRVPPSILIEAVATDDVVTLGEATAGFTISGTSSGAEGRSPTITIFDSGGGVVRRDNPMIPVGGTWSFGVLPTDLQEMADGRYTIEASVSDAAGNTTMSSRGFTVMRASVRAHLMLISDAQKTGVLLTVAGLAVDATAVITFTDVDLHTVTQPVSGNGQVLADLTGLHDGKIAIAMAITDTAGNTVTIRGTGRYPTLHTLPDLVITPNQALAVTVPALLDGFATVTVQAGGAALANLTPGQLMSMDRIRIDFINSSTGTLNLTVDQFNALGRIKLTAANIVTIRDTGDNLATLSFAELEGRQVDILDATTPLLLDLAQLDALGTVALTLSDMVTLSITQADMAFIDFAALAGRGIDLLAFADGPPTLSVGQVQALGALGLSTEYPVTVVDTAATLHGLSTAALKELSARGVDELRASDPGGSLTVSRAQYDALGAMRLSAGGEVVLADTGRRLQSLTATQLGSLALAGVTRIDATDDKLTLDATQYQALGSVELTDADTVVVADTGSHLKGLLRFGGPTTGVDVFDATDDVMSLTVQELGNLAATTLTQKDLVTLEDDGPTLTDYLRTLSTTEITALGGRGIDRISATDLTLDAARLDALGATLITPTTVLTVIGTALNDSITFREQTFRDSTAVDGKDGVDRVTLKGDYSAGVSVGGLSSIERLSFGAGFDYTITATDGTVGAGQTLQVSGTGPGAGDSLVFDGALETDGSFDFRSGAGDNSFTGGRLGDRMTAGAGVDTLRVTGAAQSTSTAYQGGYDTVYRFDGAVDRLVLAGVSAFDGALPGGPLSKATFNDTLMAVAASLEAGHAALFIATGGNLDGATFVLANVGGHGTGYQGGADIIICLEGAVRLGSLSGGSFA